MTIILETFVLDTLEKHPIVALGFEGEINAEAVLEGYMKSLEVIVSGEQARFRIIDISESKNDQIEIIKVIRSAVMITSSTPLQIEKSIVFVGTPSMRNVIESCGFAYFDSIDDALNHFRNHIQAQVSYA